MSECVVRMEMPKENGCAGCDAECVSALYGRVCGITRKNIMPFMVMRPDWCPIIAVLPEKHGRLVDADHLLRDIEEYHVSEGKFQHWLELQHTIVPAEGSET